MRRTGRTLARKVASLARVPGTPNQPPDASVPNHSPPCRLSSSTGMAQRWSRPSGSFHSSIRPHSLPSASRVMPRTKSGGPRRMSLLSPSALSSCLYSPARFPSATMKKPSGMGQASSCKRAFSTTLRTASRLLALCRSLKSAFAPSRAGQTASFAPMA